jgi:hypothetical protein
MVVLSIVPCTDLPKDALARKVFDAPPVFQAVRYVPAQQLGARCQHVGIDVVADAVVPAALWGHIRMGMCDCASSDQAPYR